MSFPLTLTGRINFPAAVDQPVGKRLLQAIVDDLAVAKSNKVVKSYTGKGHAIDFTFESMATRMLSHPVLYFSPCSYPPHYQKFMISTATVSSVHIEVNHTPNGIIVTYTGNFLETFKWSLLLFPVGLLCALVALTWDRKPEIFLIAMSVLALGVFGIYYLAGCRRSPLMALDTPKLERIVPRKHHFRCF